MAPLRIFTYLLEITRNDTRYVKIGHTKHDIRKRLQGYPSFADVRLVGYIVSGVASYEYLLLHLITQAGLTPAHAREYFDLGHLELIEDIFYTISAMTNDTYVPSATFT